MVHSTPSSRVNITMLFLAVAPALLVMDFAAADNLRAPALKSRAFEEGRERLEAPRSLISTRDPRCNLPEADPCTVNTTAIGMLEAGYSTFYDEVCEAGSFEGCYTANVANCRTCYLDVDIYMNATGATERNRPAWLDCPCCVTTTLQTSHHDLEVVNFDYSIFAISAEACTDAPTTSPSLVPTSALAPTPAPVPGTPSPTVASAPTPAPISPTAVPTLAPVSTLAPIPTTPGPTAVSVSTSQDLVVESTPSPSVIPVTSSTTADITSDSPWTEPPSGAPADPDSVDGTNQASVDRDSSDDGFTMGEKVAIGIGAGVGVIIVGLTGFGIYKVSTREST